MPEALIEKNLVSWDQEGEPSLGVVTSVEPNGRQVAVHFEDGSEHAFKWPSEVIERLVLPTGQHVRVLSSGAVGVITAVTPHNGLVVYQVSLPGGSSPQVMEDGVRPAAITDPVERLRAGELDNARSTNLRLAGTRLLYAYQHDELSTLGNSRVEIKPHQVGVVHRVAEAYPHRFILADEVGLGKTIEAGLIIRELVARGIAKRILILAPSGLVGQWQHELKTKFNMSFSLLNSDSARFLKNEHPTENMWTVRDHVIASTTYAAWDADRRRDIARAGWDMVIVDEAHHVRRTYEGPGRSTPTQLYKLVEEIADPDVVHAQSMLLLTATPMQLHRFELYSLIELLDPALFPTFDDFDSHANELRGLNQTVEAIKTWSTLEPTEKADALDHAEYWLGDDCSDLESRALSDRENLVEDLQGEHRLSQVMVRNRKRVVGGFQPRTAAIWEVELSEREWEAYNATTDYLREGFARSRASQNNALGFLMATFQKMNTSSSHTLKRSLIRRIAKLEEFTEADHRKDIVDDSDLEEMPTAEALDSLLVQRMDADWQEVRELEQLVALLDGIELDSKTRVLQERLAELLDADPHAKVILFTQFIDTQTYIQDHIGGPWSLHLFNGKLKPEEKDAAVARFRDGSGPQLLISTEAGGEGRNFQFCHLMINYDLPWNPMKVEQRIGRVDRIGQKHPVVVFNFSTKGTIEERVVDVLQTRIGVFEETIGGLDPILGSVEKDLRKILLLAEAEAEKQLGALEGQIEARMHQARAAEERLADFIMDTRSYRKDEVERLLERKRAVVDSDVKRFVLGALAEMDVTIDREAENDGVFKVRLNSVFERYFPDETKEGRTRRVTFDLATALDQEELEFFAFGHPIVDGLVQHVRRSNYPGITSFRTILSDEVDPVRGWFFVFQLELRGITTTRELLPIFLTEDGAIDPERARWLLDRAMAGRREDFGEDPTLPGLSESFGSVASTAQAEALGALIDRQTELEATNAGRLEAERRKRQRFYDYRAQAAADKLEACRSTYERLAASGEEADRRILPVWAKNVENAERMEALVEREREERLAELEGRDHVTAQHELFSASFVSIEPDPRPLFAQVQAALPERMYKLFKHLCRPTTPVEVRALEPKLAKRRGDLLKLAQKMSFNVRLAVGLADSLTAAVQDADHFTPAELHLLIGAVLYFLELEDDYPDIKSEHGFDDDALVANSVLEVLGRTELLQQSVLSTA